MSSAPDDVLTLLRQQGRTPDPAALEALMRGVAAAPEGLAGPEWVELVDPAAGPALTEALQAWRRDLAGREDGLGAAPAPAGRLADLRAELQRRGLDGFMVPRADEHQGEYVPRSAQRLAWLTGFRGSAGLAIVLAHKAAIFIDGRYTLAVRSQVEEIIGQGQQAPSGHIPFTPRAKKVLELSLREALQLGHNYIGTEHILLGLIREGEGVAAQVLVKLGADLSRVRQQVIQLLSGYAGGKEPAGAGAQTSGSTQGQEYRDARVGHPFIVSQSFMNRASPESVRGWESSCWKTL